MAAILKGLSIEKKALIVTADANETVELSARNLPGVTVVEANGINVLDVVGHEKLVMTGRFRTSRGSFIMQAPPLLFQPLLSSSQASRDRQHRGR